jgi:hypothetical protein
MKIMMYNSTTKELFGIINFEKPTLFRNKKYWKLIRTKYCYFFPQCVNTWDGNYKIETMYYFLFWRLRIFHTGNMPKRFQVNEADNNWRF